MSARTRDHSPWCASPVPIVAARVAPMGSEIGWIAWRRIRGTLERDPVLDHIAREDVEAALRTGSEFGAFRGGGSTVVRAAAEGFTGVARFLYAERVRKPGPRRHRWQIVILAAVLSARPEALNLDPLRRRLACWYWNGVFSGIRFRQPTLIAQTGELLAWIDGGELPTLIRDGDLSPTHFRVERRRSGAAYHGISALLLQQSPRDLLTGEPIEVILHFEEDRGGIDVHHIFPRAWCRTHGIPDEDADSIVNKTPVGSATNRSIGGRAPSEYLSNIERAGVDRDRLDDALRGHLIDVEALRANDFERFFEIRSERLLNLARAAMRSRGG